jgi:hypothetical protein
MTPKHERKMAEGEKIYHADVILERPRTWR